MKRVDLGARTYFVTDQPRVLFHTTVEGDTRTWRRLTADVFMQDNDGNFVPVHDELTVTMVKAAAAEPPVASNTAVPAWRRKLDHWLGERIRAGHVTESGKCWLITMTKEAAYDQLEVKIDLNTFKRQVQPKTFTYRGLPLKWDSPGGRPKTKDR